MSIYIDSHCHLNDEAYKDDLDAVILNSWDRGVRILNVIGYDIESSKKAIKLAEKYDFVYASIGIHPENIDGLTLDDVDIIRGLAKSKKVIVHALYIWFLRD